MIVFSQKTVYRLVMVLAVCVFILANLVAGKLVNLFDLTIDFTGERLYSLSSVSKNTLSALQSQTSVYIISEETVFPPVLREFLRRYNFLSPMINIRYIDPYKDPVFLNHYSMQGFKLEESDLLVVGINGIKHILIIVS